MSFDYVVVGAGSAGCLLANRLSEDPHVTVALIGAAGADTGNTGNTNAPTILVAEKAADLILAGGSA